MEFVKHVETTRRIYAMVNHAFKIKIVYHKHANMENALLVIILTTIHTVITILVIIIITAFQTHASIKSALSAQIPLLPFVTI
jgi:hypothetical protein